MNINTIANNQNDTQGVDEWRCNTWKDHIKLIKEGISLAAILEKIWTYYCDVLHLNVELNMWPPRCVSSKLLLPSGPHTTQQPLFTILNRLHVQHGGGEGCSEWDVDGCTGQGGGRAG
jgi:hypothetical protein